MPFEAKRLAVLRTRSVIDCVVLGLIRRMLVMAARYAGPGWG